MGNEPRPVTWDVIDPARRGPQTEAMNLHTFLLIDSVLLDVAGVAALIGGETALGAAFLVVAAMAFFGGLARRRRLQTVHT
jgi:hypothetical protein